MKFLILFLLSVCSTSFAGGVTGGGGNTRPGNPVTSAEVRASLRNARKYVLYYFNHLESRDVENPGKDPLLTKLFRGPVTILDVLRQVDVTPNENGACFYNDANPVDGSAVAGPKPKVCLSIPRLSAELSKDNLRAQLLALIAHEYSHLVGFSEAEAVTLQIRMLNDLIDAKWSDIDSQASDIEMTVSGRVRRFSAILAHPQEDSWEDLHTAFDWDADTWRTESQKNLSQTFQLFDDFGTTSMLMTQFRLGFLVLATCVITDKSGKDPDRCKQQIDLLFGQGPEITGQSIADMLGGGNGNPDQQVDPRIAQMKYRRVTDRATLVIEARRARQEFGRFAEQIRLENRPLVPATNMAHLL